MAFQRRRASAAATVAVIIGLGLATSPTRILSALSGCGGGCQDDSQCGEGTCCGGSCCDATCCSGTCTDLTDDQNCGECGNDCNANGSCLFRSTCTQQSFTTTASCSGKPGPPTTIYYYACSF